MLPQSAVPRNSGCLGSDLDFLTALWNIMIEI
jgi:hypothetical protein